VSKNVYLANDQQENTKFIWTGQSQSMEIPNNNCKP